MNEHPNNTRGDVAYWGLTHAQAAHHHARIARMYADQAVRYTRRAAIGNRIAMVLAGLGIALAVVKLAVGA